MFHIKEKHSLLLLFVFYSFVTISTAANLDSLKAVFYDTTQPDSNRFKAVQVISWQIYRKVQPDSSAYFGNLLHQLAIEKKNKWWEARGLFFQGIAFTHVGLHSKSVRYLIKAAKLYKEIGDINQEGVVLNDIGLICYHKGDYANAILYLHKSLKVREKTGIKSQVAQCYNNIG